MSAARLAAAFLWSFACLGGAERATAAVGDDRHRVQAAREVEMLSAQAARLADAAVLGSIEAFLPLQAARERIESNVTALGADAPATPDVVKMEAAWSALAADISTIVAAKEALLHAPERISDMVAQGARLSSQMNEVMMALAGQSDGAAQVVMVSRQALLIERMNRRLAPMLAGTEEAKTAEDAFSRDLHMYNMVLDSLIDGNAELGVAIVVEPRAKPILIGVRQQWKALDARLQELASVTSVTLPLKETSEALDTDSEKTARTAVSLAMDAASAGDLTAQALLTQIAVQAERAVFFAGLATGGNDEAFQKLDAARVKIAADIERLVHGDSSTAEPYKGATIAAARLTALIKLVTAFNANVEKITSQKTALLNARANAAEFSAIAIVLNQRIDEAATILAGKDALAIHVHEAANQMILVSRILAHVAQLQGRTATTPFIDELQRDAAAFEPALKGLIQYVESHKKAANHDSAATLYQVRQEWPDLIATLGELLAKATAMHDARLASDRIMGEADALALQVDALMH